MSNLFSNLLAMSIAGSVVVGLMLLLRPVTAKIFPAKWQYGIGKMAIAFFLLPVFLFTGSLPLVHPIAENYPAEPSLIQKSLPTLPSNGFIDTMDTLVEKHLTVELTQTILLIWFMGTMVFAGWHFYCYRRFSKQLRTDCFPVSEDSATAVLLSSCKAALGIHSEVKLMMNPKIKSPMLVGLCRPMILLPTSNMREHDLKFVLTHELMHLKRKDLWVKMLALLAGTVHWFNPLVHVLRKDISTWGELSCDEALACEMSHEERKLYGEAILNTLDNQSGMNTAFCSSLCESRKHIERRLTLLLNVKKTKKHIAAFAVVAMVTIAGVGATVAALAAENTPNLDDVQLLSKGTEPLKHEQPSDNNKGQNQQPLPKAVSYGELEILENTSMSFGVDRFSKPFTKKIEEIAMVKESVTEQVTILSAEEIAGAIKMDLEMETLISVKLSDESKFTPEQWQDILKKIESGEIRGEAE
ncbi:beta-lactamase regulating signal transducer with metallopeptidase domain [Anaerotaenia torta]|uniref:M56 family metallopeptidase n=1 Tax=Anaerotaenia torta TaxID=433293 RepID=UPI003D22B66F